MKTNYLTEAKGDTIRWLRSWFSPSENPNVNPPAEPVAPPAPKAARTNGPTILVVDDDPVFLKATAMKLENNGFEVITAKDGSEAI